MNNFPVLFVNVRALDRLNTYSTLHMFLERLGLQVNMNIMYNCGFERGERYKNGEMWHWKVYNVDLMKVIIYA